MNITSLKDLRKLDRDDLLELIGLQRKTSAEWVLPTIGALSVGILVGAGLGLLFAPKPGAELREDITRRIQEGSESISTGTFSNTNNLEKPARTV